MLRIERNGTSIKVKPNEIAAFGCIVMGAMACVGVKLLIDQWPGDGQLRGMDAVGVGFILLWIGFVLWMGSKFLEYATAVLVLDDEGVAFYGIRQKRTLKWEEIRDYGLHFIGRNRGRNNYELYFAANPQPGKNGQSKRLGKDVLRIHVQGSEEYDQVMFEILSYCRNRAGAEPFLAGKFCL